MKLLIADDEKITRDSIQLIIEREGLQEIDLMAAASGGSAIEAAREFRPDAIFMDIDMPGLNGLEAIQSIREFDPEVLIVILTAYDVFQYAQTAIRCGVYDYLLKPFTPQKIVELLSRIQEKLRSGAHLQKRIIQLREQVASMRAVVNLGILNMMITKTGLVSTLEQKRVLPESSGQILLINVKTEETRFWAEKYIRKYESQTDCVIFGPFLCGQAIVFVPRSVPVRSLYDSFAAALPSGEFCMSCGRLQPSLSTLWISYHQALEAMYTQGGSFRLYQESGPSLDDRITVYRRLAECCLDEENDERVITDVLCQITVPDDLQKSILQTGHLVMLLAETLYSRSQANLKLSEMINLALARIMTAGSVVDLCREFGSLVIGLRQRLSESNLTADHQMTLAILRYVGQNLEKNISIESAARELRTSPGALSRIMREDLGKSFVSVLTEARIQKAISLIQSGRHSMKEICFMVGYNDPNYFSRVFKRVTGENPSAYRP